MKVIGEKRKQRPGRIWLVKKKKKATCGYFCMTGAQSLKRFKTKERKKGQIRKGIVFC